MDKNSINGYELTRQWFDYSFENPGKVSPTHTALYCWLVELNNRLGWKKHFGAPASYCMEAIGIKSYNTFHKTFLDLIEWGFVEVVQKSKNQYSANVIALSIFNKALDKALDKALQKHLTKQSESTCNIDKQVNKETKKPLNTPVHSDPVLKTDFIDSIIQVFKVVYPDYIITTPGKERSSAARLATLWKGLHPDIDSQQILESMRDFFTQCQGITNAWHRDNMSLTHIASKYNAIVRVLEKGGTKPDLKNMDYSQTLNTKHEIIDN